MSSSTLPRKRIPRVQVEVIDSMWTTSEVMAYLKISRKKLGTMVSNGELPGYRLGPTGDLRFHINDVKSCLVPLPNTGKLQM